MCVDLCWIHQLRTVLASKKIFAWLISHLLLFSYIFCFENTYIFDSQTQKRETYRTNENKKIILRFRLRWFQDCFRRHIGFNGFFFSWVNLRIAWLPINFCRPLVRLKRNSQKTAIVKQIKITRQWLRQRLMWIALKISIKTNPSDISRVSHSEHACILFFYEFMRHQVLAQTVRIVRALLLFHI